MKGDNTLNALSRAMLRASEIMRQELADIRDNFDHPSIKGDGSEEILRRFLRKHLPKGLEIGKGQIIDHTGRQSRQCDVVVYNPLRAPTFAQSDNHQVFPAEGVVAVIEVKTSLRRADIAEIVDRMKSVKSLDRSAFVSPWKESDTLSLKYNWYGNEYDFPPILFFVFSFESGALEGIWEQLMIDQTGLAVDSRVDSVYCLDKGALIWQTPGKSKSSAIPDLSYYWSLVPTQHVLLLFYILSFQYLVDSIDLMRFNVRYYAPSIIETTEVLHYAFKGSASPEDVWRVLLSEKELLALYNRETGASGTD